MIYNATFPSTRLRRLRQAPWIRDLVEETRISTNDLILPMFVVDGKGEKQVIEKMPDVYRYSTDVLLKELEEVVKLGIKAIALFPKIDDSLKNEKGSEAFKENNLITKTVKEIKNKYPDLGVICDVALDPYTSHGHDGIIVDNKIDNDITVEALCVQALALCKAGCDMVAPSDMMDHRIKSIRDAIDSQGYKDTLVLAYSVKYASSFYGAFRDAVGSMKSLKGDKKTYQMNPANSNEAIREAYLDIIEGADIIMVKPVMHYLDIVRKLADNFPVPIFGYHVSSEYSMLKAAAKMGYLDYDKALMESILSIKRAGCNGILTYAACEVAKILNI